MLYHLHELQKAALTPFRLAAEANQLILRSPWNPLSYTHGGRALAAALELFESSVRPYGKPEFGIDCTKIGKQVIPVDEEVLLDKPFCELRHFKRKGAVGDPRLLIVAPLSGHYATLLRGTVKALLPEHDICITDWRDARLVPLSDGPFDLDDYIDYVIEFLRRLGPGPQLMAVCQPSVPVLAAAALLAAADDPCRPASMVLMGGPIDTRINPTVPNAYAQSHPIEWFEKSVISRVPYPSPGFMRRVYPGFLQLTGFMSMNLDRHIGAHIQQFYNLVKGDGDSAAAHRTFYKEYRAVMDLPAEYYLQTVQRVFQDHDLPQGRFRHRGRLVDPAAITDTALMTVEGENDDISGVGQTQAAHDLCTALPKGKRAHHEQEGVGHYGVFNGRRWRQEIAPRVAAFIRTHDKG